MLICKAQCFFFSREHQKCPWTLFFGECSRALIWVHGHFLRKVHGQVVAFTGTFLDLFTATFLRFTGKKNRMFTDTSWCSRAYFDFLSFMFTGTFQCSRALLPKKNEISFDKRKIKGLMFSWIFLNP